MHTIRSIALLSVVSLAAAISMPLGGCEKKAEPAKSGAGAGTPAKTDDHAHTDGHDHAKPAADKSTDSHDDHSHGTTTQLGEQTAGGYTVKASRDGTITPGKDAAIDVWLTGGTTKVAAVRFWIGTQDAKGSVKAKAAIEKDNWHTHAEVPNPMPAGSKLWVEIETDKGEKLVASFELKM